MPESPTISIVMPTHDRPEGLARCLDALARCTAPPGGFEVVVAASRPDPRVRDAVESASRPGLAVRLLEGPDSGRPDARNRGAREARGRMLAFVDDDCLPEPAWVATLAAALESRPDALVGGRVVNALPCNRWAEAAQLVIEVGYAHFARGDDAAAYFGTNNLALSRTTIEALGGFDRDFVAAAEDRDLSDRARRSGHPLVHAPDAVVAHSHDLTLNGLWRQQRSYGRGAAILNRRRAREGLPPLFASPRFFARLLAAPWRARSSRSGSAAELFAAVLLTQLAYASGLVAEACSIRTRGRVKSCTRGE